MDLLKLSCGDTCLTLAPAIGGGIAAFRWQGVDMLRPADAAALARRDPLGLASFPLVPWSNRIGHGRFDFGGRAIGLPANFGDHPHVLHGHGWQAGWTVETHDEGSATLAYAHEADAWPWRYRAAQRFELGADGFSVRLSVENRGATAMPAGLGHHPYLLKTAAMRLYAQLDGWWETDALVMPTEHHPERRDDWSDRLHARATTDHVFTGWDGRARIEWPERDVALAIAADPARWLVIYAPVDEGFVCVEPATHPTDAFNDPSLPGVAILEPGASVALDTRFTASAL